jgi:hypothetical protein
MDRVSLSGGANRQKLPRPGNADASGIGADDR